MNRKNLLVYINGLNGVEGRLQKVVEMKVSKDQVEICRNVESLTRRLRRPRINLDIAVLLASSIKDFEAILSIAKLLNNFRIILILPDRKHETASMGFKLYPRFISYKDGDFNDVTAVLGKMLEHLI